MRWETCRLESLSHWVHRQIDPQDSHSDWYRKWGKTMRPKTNIGLGPVLGGGGGAGQWAKRTTTSTSLSPPRLVPFL